MRPLRAPSLSCRSWRFVALVALAALAVGGCADQVFRTTQNFDRPFDVALSCWRPATADKNAVAVPLAACSQVAHDLYGFVTNTERSGVSVLDVLRRENLDVPYGGLAAGGLPGFTRAKVGELPAVIVSDPRSLYVYTVNRGSSDLSRIEATPGGGYAVVAQALPYRPYDAVVGPYPGETWVPWSEPEPTLAANETAEAFATRFRDWEDAAVAAYASVRWALYVSAPDAGAVLVVPLDAEPWGTLGGPDLLAYELTGGAPAQLAMAPDGSTLYVTHLDRGYVSIVDVATGAEEWLWIAPACANGVDDDGDGLVDAADPACADAADDDERDPEWGDACANGVDDDGDGATDGDDAGCGDDPAVYACWNGVDDDGDGLVDTDDPGCDSRRDDSEGSDQVLCASEPRNAGCAPPEDLPTPAQVLAIEMRCGNGLDDDGDGVTDGADESECPGLVYGATSCWNALDDDGDGAVDDADTEACPTAFATGEALPACSNGVDDDGDGAADWPDDPGCYSRAGATEQDPPSIELGAIAVSPDGAFVYVADQTNWAVHVFSRADEALVDVLDGASATGGHPMWRRLGRRGIQIGAAPRGIAFVSLPDHGVEAYVTTAAGTTAVIETVHPGLGCGDTATSGAYRFAARPLHRQKADFEAVQSALGQPVLLRGFDAIDLAFTVIPDFPSMGPFLIEKSTRRREDLCGGGSPTTCCQGGGDDDGDGLTDCDDPDCAATDACRCPVEAGQTTGEALVNPYVVQQPDEIRRYYGVAFTDDPRLQQNETWTVRYEGSLPGTDRVGRFVDEAGSFHDPDVDWCALGVEPGDLLVVKAREGCYRCGDFVGETFEWRIASVHADTLVLEGRGVARAARPNVIGTTTVCLREAGVALPPETFDDFTAPQTVALSEDVPLPSLACFGGPVDYEIRVPGRYVVAGSSTGYVHNWRNDGGRCVPRADADARFVGRADEARLAADKRLSQCPPDADGFASLYDGDYFENFAFRVRLYPGCQRNLDGSYASLGGRTERDLAWRFQVSSGFSPRRIITGQLPGRARDVSTATLRRVYVVDSAGEAIFEVTADFDSESMNYTFF